MSTAYEARACKSEDGGLACCGEVVSGRLCFSLASILRLWLWLGLASPGKQREMARADELGFFSLSLGRIVQGEELHEGSWLLRIVLRLVDDRNHISRIGLIDCPLGESGSAVGVSGANLLT